MEVQQCRMCESNYHEYPNDMSSRYEDVYIRHLGFCDMDCYNQLTDKGKTYYKSYAYIFGDDLKKNNIKVPKRHKK